MLPEQVIRSWKDDDFRRSLSQGELASLPANPAGLVELTDNELLAMQGGTGFICVTVIITVGAIVVSGIASCIAECE